MSNEDKLAAIRELFETWLESRPPFRTTVEVRAAWDGWKANTAVAAMLAAHERAQPASDAAKNNALTVLGYIRDAKRNDPKRFENDAEFADWAQSWARHATQVFRAPAHPASVAGWRVIPFTGSVNYGDDRWEIYDPTGSGGVVRVSDVRLVIVRELLDALAAAPQPAKEGE